MSEARSHSSLSAVLLSQRLVDVAASPLKASEYWSLLERVPDPVDVLGATAAALVGRGVDPEVAERAVRLVDAATSVAFEVDRLEQSGIRVVASVDAEYPDALRRLGRAAPPLLYVAGDPAVLTRDVLGVVGSRDVGMEGAEVAKTAARVAAERNVGVVSGGAKGVDRLAMKAAFYAGGFAIGVLADSLLRTLRDPETRRVVLDGSVCLCTPYKPSAGFSVANAMGRNKIIYALSAATLVVATDLESGGTWAGAVEALRQRLAPVLVWVGDEAAEGNAALVARGAVPVTAMDDLFPLPGRPPPLDPGHQLALEV